MTQVKFWQFRFSGEAETREIPYGEFEAFLESLPLPKNSSGWLVLKGIADIRDIKLKKIGEE